MKLGDWFDERAGWRRVLKGALHEPVLGGASMAYVFGSVLTFLLLLQMTTGVLLAFYYAPSSTDAWASVAHIQDVVTMGWLVRGLHHHGASAMVIVAGLHLLQVAVWGAYKKPRELNWIVGVLLLGLILAFALTGYLLPWDQTGYWATKVATGIAGASPVVGQQLQEVAQGGNEYGNLTLTRFYALHVFVLPAATLGLVAIHLALFRKHGVTPRWGKDEAALRRAMQPFWPDQLFRDLVGMAIAFAALLAWVWHEGGARLDAPADPSSNFDARPEWYFRPLFQVLKYFEGSMETVVALGTPVVVGGFLLGLPFLDRGPDRNPKKRVLPLGLLGAGIAATGALTMISFQADASDPDLAKRQHASELQGKRARALAKAHGVPAAGGTAVYATAPFYTARTIWARECASCHDGDERKAPAIGAGYNSRGWIEGFLKAPSGEAYWGRTELGKSDGAMPAVEASPEEMKALVEAVYAETGAPDVDAALAKQGRELFAGDASCTDCHGPLEVAKVAPAPAPAVDAGVPEEGEAGAEEGEEAEEPEEPDVPTAPNLIGRGAPPYLRALIKDAAAPDVFGAHDKMPAFVDELAPAEITALIEWLTWLRTASVADVTLLDAPDTVTAP